MWVFYFFVIRMYVAGIHLAAMFSPKAKRWVRGRKNWETLLREKMVSGKKTVWMHCASLGEFEMGRPVLEAIRNDYPDHQLIITFFSPSGYEVRKNFSGADAVLYLPSDLPGNINKFLNLTRPQLAVFVKYEFWFGYLRALQERKIHTMLISGRFRAGQHFFRWYGKWFYKRLFCFDQLHVQDQESAKLTGTELQNRVIVSGDTRYDRVLSNAVLRRELPEITTWLGGRDCLVAGSTWPVDDPLMLPWKHPDLALIIAPHEVHPHRIRTLKQQAGDDAVLYSELPLRQSNILIIDNVGMLMSIYALGKLAYVGGGFGSGLHNILEPAAFGLPVIFGPDHEKFPEAAALESAGAARSIQNRKAFDAAIAHFTTPSGHEMAASLARKFVSERTGATAMIMKSVHELLE